MVDIAVVIEVALVLIYLHMGYLIVDPVDDDTVHDVHVGIDIMVVVVVAVVLFVYEGNAIALYVLGGVMLYISEVLTGEIINILSNVQHNEIYAVIKIIAMVMIYHKVQHEQDSVQLVELVGEEAGIGIIVEKLLGEVVVEELDDIYLSPNNELVNNMHMVNFV